jgi:hypothetical protein
MVLLTLGRRIFAMGLNDLFDVPGGRTVELLIEGRISSDLAREDRRLTAHLFEQANFIRLLPISHFFDHGVLGDRKSRTVLVLLGGFVEWPIQRLRPGPPVTRVRRGARPAVKVFPGRDELGQAELLADGTPDGIIGEDNSWGGHGRRQCGEVVLLSRDVR